MAGNSFPPRTLPELKAVSAAGLARALGAGSAHDAVVLVTAGPFQGSTKKELAALRARVEAARYVARDITGTDPEQMTPGRAAAYCEELFEGSPVAVSVLEDPKEIRRAYPLIGAVSRASFGVARHAPCVVRLEYAGSGK